MYMLFNTYRLKVFIALAALNTLLNNYTILSYQVSNFICDLLNMELYLNSFTCKYSDKSNDMSRGASYLRIY